MKPLYGAREALRNAGEDGELQVYRCKLFGYDRDDPTTPIDEKTVYVAAATRQAAEQQANSAFENHFRRGGADVYSCDEEYIEGLTRQETCALALELGRKEVALLSYIDRTSRPLRPGYQAVEDDPWTVVGDTYYRTIHLEEPEGGTGKVEMVITFQPESMEVQDIEIRDIDESEQEAA